MFFQKGMLAVWPGQILFSIVCRHDGLYNRHADPHILSCKTFQKTSECDILV